MAKAAIKINSAEIRKAMSSRWAAPEYAIMWEVGEGTGSHSGRYADAVIMSLWPSRGLELHGIEIKVSRSDWRREAADPKKAEAVAKYCDRWYVHTPKGLITDISEVPPAWGVREFDGRQWTTLKEASITEAAPVTRKFLAAMLRRADGTMRGMIDEAVRASRETEVEREAERRARFNDEVDKAAARRTGALEEAAKRMALFEEAFGGDFFSRWSVDAPRIGAAARALSEGTNAWGSLKDWEDRLRAGADALKAVRESMGAPVD